MGNMHIVTGFKGENHVTAADVGSLNAAIFGTGSYVLNRGSKFKTTIISNNKIRVADGDLMIQGRHVRLDEGTYVDMTIENGQQGYKRNDLIVARYTKNSSSGVEDVNLVVIKGTPASSNPVDPSYTTGDIINDHVYLADMPLFRIPLDGLNVQTIVPLYELASIDIADGSITSNKLAGGSVSNTISVSLTAEGWNDKSQTVNASGVTASNTVVISPDAASFVKYGEAQVRCTAQGTNTLTFTCEDIPTEALTVNVLIIKK